MKDLDGSPDPGRVGLGFAITPRWGSDWRQHPRVQPAVDRPPLQKRGRPGGLPPLSPPKLASAEQKREQAPALQTGGRLDKVRRPWFQRFVIDRRYGGAGLKPGATSEIRTLARYEEIGHPTADFVYNSASNSTHEKDLKTYG
jgi:hypothetical protein